MKLDIHDANLQIVFDCLNSGYSEVWLHGDGNVFPVYVYNPLEPTIQDVSKIHAENFNKGQENHSYRVKISKSNMPKSVTEANQMLQNNFMAESAKKDQVVFEEGNPRLPNVRVSETSFRDDVKEPQGDIDYSKFNKAGAKE